MNKLVVVINGKARAGKDTLCDIVINHYKARKISSITPILKIALENGWDGTKDNKSRKLLSDLKRAFIDYNDLPNNYLISEFENFLKSDDNILFVHIRESDQIDAFTKKINQSCPCVTLLVKKSNVEQSVSFGNDSDDCVDNYSYDYCYNNVYSLKEAEKDFLKFFEKILEDKKVLCKPKNG